jgi:hypothetical protein
MKIKFIWLKRIGILLTAILLILAIDPGIFNIPLSAQPWFFITNIAWLIMIVSGIFS